MNEITAPHETNPYAPNFQPSVALPDGWLGCDTCGVATRPEDQRGHFTAHVDHRRRDQMFTSTVSATRCRVCAERHEIAAYYAEEFPRGRAMFYPQAKTAANVIARCLAALAAIGITPKVNDARSLRLLLEEIRPVMGVSTPTPSDSKAAALGWAWLTEEDRQSVREAYARYLQRRVERPEPVHPPRGLGCFLCGVAAVTVLPSRRGQAWVEATVSRGNLTGGVGRERTSEVICYLCDRERDPGTAVSQSLVDRLVLRASGARRYVAEELATTATAWGTSGLSGPNETAWQHIDLEHFLRSVRAGEHLRSV